ncbi:MAG: hypothetical protein ACI8Q1_002579 [Parvicella sp.]
MHSLVVVIPVYEKALSDKNIISIKQCFSIFRENQITIVTHEEVDLSIYYKLAQESDYHDLNIEYFHHRFFKNINGYNQLLLSKDFYKRFLNFEYLLVFQDDAFVFSNDLSIWMNHKVDYVGAPWVSLQDGQVHLIGVGNGGLSLRKVAAFYKIFSSFRYINRCDDIWRKYKKMNWKGRVFHFFDLIFGLSIGSFAHSSLNTFKGHEDVYISKYLSSYVRVADIDSALKFAFEEHPSALYEMNNHHLPFGCHAWWRYDVDFWIPKIEKFGYDIA